jgi:hypothetical protein
MIEEAVSYTSGAGGNTAGNSGTDGTSCASLFSPAFCRSVPGNFGATLWTHFFCPRLSASSPKFGSGRIAVIILPILDLPGRDIAD